MKEAAYEGETEVDEVVVKVNKIRKSNNISFQIGSIISNKEIKQDYDSKFPNLTHRCFLNQTRIKASTPQVSRQENIKQKHVSMAKQSLKNKPVGQGLQKYPIKEEAACT